jgi:hypothetical protein
MRANNPITIDGNVYDHLSINLAVTYRVVDENNSDGGVAMRIIPTRVDTDTGEVITADESAIGISVGSLNGIDSDAATAVQAVKSAIETYLAAKGI